jgi:asparaginyl-tRNA synthetase
MGWVRTRRESKAGLAFVELNDGSCFDNLQLVVPASLPDFPALVARLHPGTSLWAVGNLVASQGGKQPVEVQVEEMGIWGDSDPLAYPIAKQKMSYEHLREVTHLRPRTNTFSALARLRGALARAVHGFFGDRGFQWIHTPILTANDCEGAGKTFRVTSLDLAALARSGKDPDFSKDFFGVPVNLTVSGQLEAEAYALSLGDVYTFGPTFRAENSNTSRHLAEFWMVEPEMAFADLEDDMDLAEAFLKHLCRAALEQCPREMQFFRERVDAGAVARLEQVAERPFARLTYTEAVKILHDSGERFEFPVAWGSDLQSEHERHLTEKVFQCPVILTDYPKEIKAFYMKVGDDGRTVRAINGCPSMFTSTVKTPERASATVPCNIKIGSVITSERLVVTFVVGASMSRR